MIIFKGIKDLKAHLLKIKKLGSSIGFVPTMGALHQGHMSLIKESTEQTDFTVCSIFVNPTQFNNKNDFTKYPVTIEKDIQMLEDSGCDVLFLPSVTEIYPAEYKPAHYELGYLENILEGAFRPGHFQGVCQVVEILLMIAEPDLLFLGEKDFQQCMVISKMVKLKNIKVKIRIAPTLREKDGLAMSSRNLRLSDTERKNATAIYNALKKIASEMDEKDAFTLQDEGKSALEKQGFKVDYIEIADAESLLPAKKNTKRKVIVAAAWLQEVRLIDNLVIG